MMLARWLVSTSAGSNGRPAVIKPVAVERTATDLGVMLVTAEMPAPLSVTTATAVAPAASVLLNEALIGAPVATVLALTEFAIP